MNDPQDTNPQAVASELNQLFEQALEQQRTLWEKTLRFSRDESLRFTSLWLKHTNLALENVQGQDGFKSIIQVQQDWLRDMVQDYTAQSVRFNETMSRLATGAMSRAMEAGREAVKEGHDVARQSREAAGENLDTMRQAGAEMMRANQDVVRQTGEAVGENFDSMRQAGAEVMRANQEAFHNGMEQAQPASQDYQSGQDFQPSQEVH